MPKYVDVDAQAAEGAIVYTIGGRMWYAAEPVLDTFKQVLQAAPESETPKAGEAPVAPTKAQTEQSLDAMLPQLQLVLQAWDKDANQVVQPEERPSEDFLRAHLSVKRAGQILKEVLGEGEGAAA